MNAQKWENVKTDIYGKACLYNHMIDTAIEGGYGTQEIIYLLRKLPSKTARWAEMQWHRQNRTDKCLLKIIMK